MSERGISWIEVCLIGAGLLLILLGFRVEAHEEGGWIGQSYPECCTVSGGDCAKLPSQAVAYDPMGQMFGIMFDPILLVAEKDAKISKDNDYWLCLTSDKQPRCFFRPSMGI